MIAALHLLDRLDLDRVWDLWEDLCQCSPRREADLKVSLWFRRHRQALELVYGQHAQITPEIWAKWRTRAHRRDPRQRRWIYRKVENRKRSKPEEQAAQDADTIFSGSTTPATATPQPTAHFPSLQLGKSMIAKLAAQADQVPSYRVSRSS